MKDKVKIVMSPRTAAVVLEFLHNIKLGDNEWERAITDDLTVWEQDKSTAAVWNDLNYFYGIPDIKVVSTMYDGIHFEIRDSRSVI